MTQLMSVIFLEVILSLPNKTDRKRICLNEIDAELFIQDDNFYKKHIISVIKKTSI